MHQSIVEFSYIKLHNLLNDIISRRFFTMLRDFWLYLVIRFLIKDI